MERNQSSPLPPGSTIGIIGGGQLGRMLAMAAARLGYKTIVLDPAKDCPASQTSNHHIEAAYDDVEALKMLGKRSDVITYEFENIPANALYFLEENIGLKPDRLALEKSQDRLVEKDFLSQLKIATAPYHPVSSFDELANAVSLIDTPSILKTRRFGYDGKGQARLPLNPSEDELAAAWTSVGESESILESFFIFQREISVIVCRSATAQIVAYDPAENVHRGGILRTSEVPAAITASTANEATRIAISIVEALEYVGVMGVEFFVAPNGDLAVNEIAPRVHNSGHWTEAAGIVSQFEQHIRAVANLPLGDCARHSDCVMENLIGDDVDIIPSLLTQKGVRIHLYGKAETRPGRKMGHFTRLT